MSWASKLCKALGGRTTWARSTADSSTSGLSRRRLYCWLLLIFTVITALGAPKRLSGRGLVLAVDRAGKTITISHEKIPGYMEAMVMSFNVREPSLLKSVEQGRQIYFRLN